MLDLRSLVVRDNPKSPTAEAYRVLRTNIHFACVDKPIKTIVVTSSGPEEGKTTTVSNLAITFAQSGDRVLLIDADLRRSKIHKVFDIDNKIGMTTVLSQHIDYNACLVKSSIDNLYMLTSGPIPPNPSELLSSNAMKSFIEQVKKDFDIIILDAPPVGVVTDAAILSTIVDGTILVVSSAQVEIEAAQRAKELLQKVNANILGVVLNKIAKNSKDNYYFNYYYYSEDAKPKRRFWHKGKQKKHEQVSV